MIKCWSKRLQRHYWFDRNTGVSQWTEPEEEKKNPTKKMLSECFREENQKKNPNPTKKMLSECFREYSVPEEEEELRPLCFQCHQNFAREPEFPDCAECNPHNRKIVSYANVHTMDDS